VIALVLIAKLSLFKFFNGVYLGLGRLFSTLVNLGGQHLERYRKNKRRKQIQHKYRAETAPRPSPPQPQKPEAQKRKEKKKLIRVPSRGPEESHLFSELDGENSRSTGHKFPPLTYLDAPTQKSQIDFQELDDKRQELAGRLEEFRIKGEIREYTPGPVITTYEFVPDTGVKVKDVTNLSEDLALVVKAQYVRIERILGKKAIGIEIPNKKREIIHLREILESTEYKNSSSPLTIALGKSKSGEIYTTDLREMPHLIIAGATGSGKSVAIHTIILSILYKSPPDEVKFVLIDPKRVELAIYNSLPHLLTPVVVNTKLAKNALDWTIFEIEERYKKLALLQVRNIEQFNKKIDLLTQADEEILEKLGDQTKMHYIVVIIDEFADLMMESQREIEDNIQRIAQKARAVGIHLILATQRPSTDVITGTIKNNFPSRIALAVPSKFDSRTIIDVMGAEKLLGQGDMLFLPPKTATLVRIHCAFVSEEEALRVVRYLSKLDKPKFNTQVVKPQAKEGGEAGEGEVDPLFLDAARIAITSGQASASYLQRRMRVGYARAGRLMDQLQTRGVVSAPNSKNQREILISIEDLDEMEI
jgi:S-DNA-T family DNA segregation ATPase FtsK/SpoIIIE